MAFHFQSRKERDKTLLSAFQKLVYRVCGNYCPNKCTISPGGPHTTRYLIYDFGGGQSFYKREVYMEFDDETGIVTVYFTVPVDNQKALWAVRAMGTSINSHVAFQFKSFEEEAVAGLKDLIDAYFKKGCAPVLEVLYAADPEPARSLTS